MGEKKEENGEYSVALGSFWANKKGNKRKERNRIDRNLIGLPLAHSIGKEQGGGGGDEETWTGSLCRAEG